VRGRSSAVLLALAVVALVPSLGTAQYTPKWQVGDWWITKTWWYRETGHGSSWEWKYLRYDVAGINKVGQNDCYVVEIRGDRQPKIEGVGDPGIVMYVRTDNWRLVRREMARFFGGKRIAPDVYDTPRGLVGPFVSEPRLPKFPLQLMNPDTAFKMEDSICLPAYLREISRPADSALVRRLIADGDTGDTRGIRPTGAVFEVRCEMAGNMVPGSKTGPRDITQSLQLWSDDLPWRAFEELAEYGDRNSARRVIDRSWLIAVGKRQK
jgi:hypothetical protein